MKLFVPAVGYRIKLVADWSFRLYPERRNDTLYCALSGNDAPSVSCYSSRWHKLTLDAKLEAGTVLEVDRVYIRASSKSAQNDDADFDSLTFKVVEHPVFVGKKRQVRFWVKLDDANKIEYELPIDHTAGKDRARENAKKPKKLSRHVVKDAVSNAIFAYESCHRRPGYGKTPSWLSSCALAQLNAAVDEYRRLRVPWDKAQHELNVKRMRAELEYRFNMGGISVPLAYASRVKTFQDFLEYVPSYGNDLRSFEEDSNNYRLSHVITYNIMGGYSSRSCVFSKMPDGTRCRTFRPDGPGTYAYDKDAPDMTHIWVKVHSDADDQSIVKLEAGFDVNA